MFSLPVNPRSVGASADGERRTGSDSSRARRLRVPRLAAFIALLGAIIISALIASPPTEPSVDILSLTALAILLAALACEFVDSTLGMGYGTTLTPVLLLCGFRPLQIVPVVLLSELATGLSAALAHHTVGNVDFRAGTRASRVAAVLAVCSVAGTLVAVLVAVRLPRNILTIWIGVLVTVIGITILLSLNRLFAFSWRKVLALGLVASFNKGLSGGGYGPLVTGGQVLSGIEGKNAVAITSLAEGLTCAAGLTAYLMLGKSIDWSLAAPMVTGALLSVPFSAFAVRRIRTRPLTVAIGVATIALGVLTLYKVLAR